MSHQRSMQWHNSTSSNATTTTEAFRDNHHHQQLPLIQKCCLTIAIWLAVAAVVRAICCFRHPLKAIPPPHLSALAILSAVLLYCFVADRTTIFIKLEKTTDEASFLVLCLLALLAGLATVKHRPQVDYATRKSDAAEDFELLPRRQTEEWKGWMQMVILLYHYFGMSKVLHVYRLIRVLVGSYLFLTGYGHTSYLLRHKLTFRRAVAVLVRLNFLACVLPFVMGSKYELYYFPALSTFWVLVTWITIPQMSTHRFHIKQLTYRIAFACAITTLLFQWPALWQSCADALRTLRLFDINASEFLFRIPLDRFVPYAGMLLACLNEHVRHSSNNLIPTSTNGIYTLTQRRMVVIFSLMAGYFLLMNTATSKESSNVLHPYIEVAPILVYVAIRNATSTLRQCHSRLFAWFGKYSLETFILQYHLWLAADTKKLLSFGFVCRMDQDTELNSARCWLEKLLISTLFLLASYLTGQATTTMTHWITDEGPPDMNSPYWRASSSEDWEPSRWSRLLLQASLLRRSLAFRVLGICSVVWIMNILW